jgi:peptidoglycan/LPS O-acetylase OafA/YrhL
MFAFLAIRWWPLKVAILGLALYVGTHYGWPEFIFLSMFAIGSLIAAHWSVIQSAFSRLLSFPGSGPLLLLIVVLLFTSSWWVLPFGSDPANGRWWSLSALIGAVLAVLLAAHWKGARRFLEWGPVQWLGRISFSLYLVHESVIIAVRFLMLDAPMTVVAVVAIPAAILMSWLFYLTVERPSIKLARAAGNATSSHFTRPAGYPSRSHGASTKTL